MELEVISQRFELDVSRVQAGIAEIQARMEGVGAGSKRAEASLQSLQRSLGGTEAAAVKLARTQATLQAAQEKGLITQQRAAQLGAQAAQQFTLQATAASKAEAGLRALQSSLGGTEAALNKLTVANERIVAAQQAGLITQARAIELSEAATRQFGTQALAQQGAAQAQAAAQVEAARAAQQQASAAAQAAAGLRALQGSMGGAEAAAAQFAIAEQRVNAALQAGIIDQARANQLLQASRAHSQQMIASTTAMTRNLHLQRAGWQNLGFQIQDVIIQLQAGQNAFIIFAQQGSQIASIFGTWGAAIGIALAAVGGLGSVLFGLGRTASGAAEDVNVLLEALKALGEQDQQINAVVGSVEKMSAEVRALTRLRLEFEVLPDLERQLEEADAALSGELAKVQALLEAQAALQERFGGDPAQRQALADLIAEVNKQFEAGQVDVVEFAAALERIEDTKLKGMLTTMLPLLARWSDLQKQVEATNVALQAIGSTARIKSLEPFGPPEAPRTTGTGGAAAQTTFADIVGPIEEQNQLRREGLLTEEQITALLSAQKTLNVDLTNSEEQRLFAAIATRDALDQQDKLIKDMQTEVGRQETLSGNVTQNLEQQLASLRLRNQYGDEETEQYFIQDGLLKLKASGLQNITAEQLSLNEALARELAARERSAAGAEVYEATRTAAERYADEVERLNELLDQGAISQDTFNRAMQEAKEEMVEMSLAAQVAVEASNIFAREVASGFTDAIFAGKGLRQTLEDIGIALAKAVSEAVIFNAIMMAMGSPGGGGQNASGFLGMLFGTAAAAAAGGGRSGMTSTPTSTAGAGGAAFAYRSTGGGAGWGGPRQHGGPVSAGTAYVTGEKGPELFIPRTGGTIIPNSQLNRPQVTVIDQRGGNAPPVETNVDARGMVSVLVRSEVSGMSRDGSLHRMVGVKQRGVARG